MPKLQFLKPIHKGALGALLLLGATEAHAVPVSSTDAFEGATILSTANVLAFGAEAGGSFDGSEADPLNVTFFEDIEVGSLGSVTFSTGSAATVSGIRIYAGSDGAGGGNPRSMSAFRFYADSNGDTVFEELVNLAINPDYTTGVVGDADPLQNEIELTFMFSGPVTSTVWKYEVNQGVNVGLFDGVRFQELDAISATLPEPSSFALLALGLGGFAFGQRRAPGGMRS